MPHKKYDMGMNMKYGDRLRFARKKANKTQQQLCDECGVPQVTISKIERGDQLGSSYDAQLAKSLKCSAYWLSTGEGEHNDVIASEEERLILEAYRHSSSKVRKIFDALAECVTDKDL